MSRGVSVFPQTATLKAVGYSRRPDAMSDGYRVETRIVVSERPATTIVPASALFSWKGGWAGVRRHR
jgi:hypothetical protein